MYIVVLVGLVVFTVVVTELLKKAAQYTTSRTSKFLCRECGEEMKESAMHWSYQLPFEIWAPVAKHNLKSQTVRRFVCPRKHTHSWYLPKFGNQDCDVLVTKSLHG